MILNKSCIDCVAFKTLAFKFIDAQKILCFLKVIKTLKHRRILIARMIFADTWLCLTV